jgi:L-asparaginase II
VCGGILSPIREHKGKKYRHCYSCHGEFFTACINPQYSNIGTVQYGQGVQKRIITNADRIRAMSDEELAKKISGIESFALTCGGGWPPEKWLDWLKQEVKDG